MFLLSFQTMIIPTVKCKHSTFLQIMFSIIETNTMAAMVIAVAAVSHNQI